jgi:hypothetical protein
MNNNITICPGIPGSGKFFFLIYKVIIKLKKQIISVLFTVKYFLYIINNVPFFIAKWSGVPEGFIMPVNLSCEDSIPPVLIEVTTEPTIFYLKDKLSCSEFYINKMHSYFNWIENIGLLYEIKKD